MCRTQLSSTTVTLLWKELYTNGTPGRVPFVSSRGTNKFIALFQTAGIQERTRWESAEIALLALGTELSPLSRLCEPESLSVEMESFTLRLCSRLPSMPAVPTSRELSVIQVDRHRPHHPLKSSSFSRIRTCCCGVSQRFHPPREQSSLCFDGPMIRELMALVSVDFWSLHVDFTGCPQCGTKIRAELSSNGSEVRGAGLTSQKKSTPRSHGMGIVFCISNGAHRLPPRCLEPSPHSTAPLFRFSAPFAFLREVCCGTFYMDVLQLWYRRIGVTTSFPAYLVLLHVWRLEV